MSQTKSKKKRIIGQVIKSSSEKTISVRSTIVKRHPKYMKQYTIHKSYLAHDENNDSVKGDVVEIEESMPRSKNKKWVFVRKVK